MKLSHTTLPLPLPLLLALTTILPLAHSQSASGSSASTSSIISISASTSTSALPTFPSAAVPPPPPNSDSTTISEISSLPACWQPCVGGAIKQVCPSDDSWTCACAGYFDTDADAPPDFISLSFGGMCGSCSDNVPGGSDGGTQSVLDLLVDICIGIPQPLSSTGIAATPTSTATSSSQPTHNAAVAMVALRPWQLLLAPLVIAFCGIALM